MKGSLLVLTFFAAGIAVGYLHIAPDGVDFSLAANITLYILIGLVGFEFGYGNLAKTLRTMTLRQLLLPLFTIAGTLLFSAAAGFAIKDYTTADCMAVGSGMGYYSLSSMLIIDFKQATAGLQIAAELGTIALIANIVREVLALTLAPWLMKGLGPYAPIAAAGVTSLDVTLPVITRTCGSWAIPVAIIHGVALEIAVPLLVMLCCM